MIHKATTADAFQSIDIEVDEGVATVALCIPERRNALTAEVKAELSAVVPRLAADQGVAAVVITGRGGVFCAGGDIRNMQNVREGMTVADWRTRMQALSPLIRQLVEMDKPLIAAVDGPAFGAGFGLALTADFVLATPRARFCASFLRMGLVPDFATTYTLPRIVGPQRAKELLMSAREVSATEAARLGMVLELVEPEDLLARAKTLARGFLHASPMALGMIKQMVSASLASDLAAALARETDQQALCFQSEPHRAAVDRFLSRQAPAFRWPYTGARS